MAVKDTNHRLSVTLTDEDYAAVQVLAEDMGGKSASKAAAHAVRGYLELRKVVEGLRIALDVMAGDLAAMCWESGDWTRVWSALKLGESMEDTMSRETRAALMRQLDGERGPLMGSVYRAAYVEWCDEHGRDANL